MRKLTDAERILIKTAVQNAEKLSSGEIVPLVVPKSGDYFWVMPLLAFKGLILLTIAYEFKVYLSGFPGTLMELVSAQIFGVILGALLSFIPGVARWGVGRVRLEKNVDHQALVSFVSEGLTKTKDRTGVLIYISIFERQVEILGDQGIHRHVGDEYWNALSHQLALEIGKGNLIAGLEATIKQVGDTLQKHFPRAQDDQNELSDDFRSKE